jgi:hypothetical protein
MASSVALGRDRDWEGGEGLGGAGMRMKIEKNKTEE